MTPEEMLTAAKALARQATSDADTERLKVDKVITEAALAKTSVAGHYWQNMYKLRERSRAADLLVKALEP